MTIVLQSVSWPYWVDHCRGGASTRPPKNSVFRILQYDTIAFSPDGDGFCLSKIRGRVTAPPLQSYCNIEKGRPGWVGLIALYQGLPPPKKG